MYYLDKISSRNKHKIWNTFIETNAYASNRALEYKFKDNFDTTFDAVFICSLENLMTY